MLANPSLAEKKLDIIQWISAINNDDIISQFSALKQQFLGNQNDTTLSDEERQTLQQGINDMIAGRVVPHSEVRKVYEKWL